MTGKWKIVPIEPTDKMKRALFTNLIHADDEAYVIKAIINAAPTPPNTINIDVAEYERLKKDAGIGKLVRSKMVSGNSIPVSRCTITHDEIEAIDKARSET